MDADSIARRNHEDTKTRRGHKAIAVLFPWVPEYRIEFQTWAVWLRIVNDPPTVGCVTMPL